MVPTTGFCTVVPPAVIFALLCTTGATAAIPGALRTASTSRSVSGVPLPAAPRGPPPKPRPLVTVSVLAPNPLNWRRLATELTRHARGPDPATRATAALRRLRTRVLTTLTTFARA